MSGADDFDVAAISEAYRLLALLLHCAGCEVEWHGGGPCWSCGGEGEAGGIPALLTVALHRGCGS